MPRALLSVSDKTGLVDFARTLVERGWTLLSTGGTARALREAAVPVMDVSQITQHPEMMDGRVKTLHPAIHAGLLARRANEDDLAQMREQGYSPIDLVVVNLYPFVETIGRPGVTVDEAIENIDIGGPSMLRSAAKNHESVWVVVDPADYPRVLAGLDADDTEARALRRSLAAKVYAHTTGAQGRNKADNSIFHQVISSLPTQLHELNLHAEKFGPDIFIRLLAIGAKLVIIYVDAL